ncbi:MAG TPA: MFS transporter [Candidatus Dojkabacteria bacterium]|nr:MFS transporter [Candidatus Dojkabacteria bacterium]
MNMRSLLRFNMEGSDESVSLLINISFVILLWSIFDSIMSYVTPTIITNHGFNDSEMGLIYASSSVFGGIFDFILCNVLKNVNYRRLLLLLFIISAFFPILMGIASTTFVFVLAMAVWGLYYDVMKFGVFDFVSKKIDHTDHASGFGALSIFKSIGYFIGPLVAGYIVLDGDNQINGLYMAFAFLVLSFVFYLVFLYKHRDHEVPHITHHNKKMPSKGELTLWIKIGKILLPVLIIIAFLNVIDAFFWTIGPLFIANTKGFSDYGGAFLSIYSISSLFSGFLVGKMVRKYGQKRSAFISLMMGAPFILLIGIIPNPLFILIAEFIGGSVISFAWPSIDGACADYLEESSFYSKEINSITDFAANFGYVVGPILAGVTAQVFGTQMSFASLGIAMFLCGALLLIYTPKQIRVVIHSDEKPIH